MSISTISFNNASRATIMKVQAELRDSLTESSTGRHADVGRTLGRLTGNAVTLRSQETSLDRMLETNTLATQRLGLMDDTLDTIFKSAEALSNNLIAGLNNADFLRSAVQLATDGLEQMTGALNLSSGGQYLFAGTQTDLKPFDATKLGLAQTAVDTQFAALGIPSALTGADMTAYLTGAFAAGFDTDANWSTWSNASSENITARISKSETIETSLSANEEAFRDLAAGYTMLSQLASSDLNEGARAALAAEASARLNAGMTKITALRSELGNRMARVEAADTSLKQQKDIVTISLASLEEIDLVEASTRVAALQTQLEVSYRVTGLIREISILDYL